MDYLHNNRDLFLDTINLCNRESKLSNNILEKDYYVTLLLKLLSQKLDFIVFKGGTSLSKAQNVINRFSEDIDISTNKKLSQSEKKKLKKDILDSVCELGLEIVNIEEIRSRRDYNLYKIEYNSLFENSINSIKNTILIEVVYMSIAYPSVKLKINNYFNDYLPYKDVVEEYGLNPFIMNVQSLERTFIDKVFAICDYYLLDKKYRSSRHIYDLYKIYPLVNFDDAFKKLVNDIRLQRIGSNLRPSADLKNNINVILEEIIDSEFYKNDFNEITKVFLNEEIEYRTVIKVLKQIIIDRYFI